MDVDLSMYNLFNYLSILTFQVQIHFIQISMNRIALCIVQMCVLPWRVNSTMHVHVHASIWMKQLGCHAGCQQVSRCRTWGIWGICCNRWWNRLVKESTLALKPKIDITRVFHSLYKVGRNGNFVFKGFNNSKKKNYPQWGSTWCYRLLLV